MNCRELTEAALSAIEDERLPDADALLAEAMQEPNRCSDLLELADTALGNGLLEVAEGHLRQALREDDLEA
jgi:thioredoxin-like negative regulator of GroEL